MIRLTPARRAVLQTLIVDGPQDADGFDRADVDWLYDRGLVRDYEGPWGEAIWMIAITPAGHAALEGAGAT